MTEKTLRELVDVGLEQGIAQVEAVGSPLHPFLVAEDGTLMVLFDAEGGTDPMRMALPAIKQRMPNVQRCVLVLDSRVTLQDGKKWDAILVMACERDAERGEVWAQRYVPKGFFRKFRVEGTREQVGEVRNFIQAALAG
jgi:hypothetical protein